MILLLNPLGAQFRARSGRWSGRENRSGYLPLPVFLARAAGVLKANGFQIKLLDAIALSYSLDDLNDYLLKNPPQVIVAETSTPSIEADAKVAKYLKNKTGATIVFVGAHVTALPVETLRSYPVDVVCMGEYDYTLPDLCQALLCKKPLEQVKGIAFKKEGKIILTERRKLVNLDPLPIPAYEDLPLKRYYDPIVRNRPCVWVRTSRGCPYHCIFCVPPQVLYNYTVRYRSPEKVADEVKHLIDMGVKEIFVDDETFTLSKKHVLGICEEFGRRKIRIDWSCFGRCDRVDEEMLSSMKQAGCYMIRYGIESGDQKILDFSRKGLGLTQIEKAFALTKKFNLKTHATVMFGMLGETKQTMRKTLDFVKKLDPDYAQFTIAIPYPGTRYYQMMKEAKKLLSARWSDYDGSCEVVTKLDDLIPSQVKQFVDFAYRSFYLRPKYIYRRLCSLRNMEELYHIAKSGSILMGRSIRNINPARHPK